MRWQALKENDIYSEISSYSKVYWDPSNVISVEKKMFQRQRWYVNSDYGPAWLIIFSQNWGMESRTSIGVRIFSPSNFLARRKKYRGRELRG